MTLHSGLSSALFCSALLGLGCSSEESNSAAVGDAAVGTLNGAAGSGGGGSGNAGAPTGTPGQVGGCTMFPGTDDWNKDISGVPVDATWSSRLQTMVGNIRIHPDFGNAPPDHYGIPVNVVPKSQPSVAMTFDGYPDECDNGPFPLPDPSVAKIEGGTPTDCSGDCHFLVIQEESCLLFEGYACSYTSGWRCSNGAKWDLTKVSYGQRPEGWTSADAAGLPIAPGLLRVAEVRAGKVTHAIRFTVRCTQPHYVAHATHQAVPGGCDPTNSPPMGLRVRMKADYDISGLSQSAQVVATGMKTYGMIIADNGSNFYFQGEDDPGWTDEDVEPLKTIPASAFEAITPGAFMP